ncbi:aminotransferase-like, plant mobile domain family protein [Actinidia rufa]|uniref:Aminotransferase-like, plant mobile domain family protein n=1 Tax=Actinidia rufa TaxID=165716 RepID=A0A7J0G4K0_9ERIC|nr:aminotransferase-like, plant mobile domain family protein [Actinidia rufa]
MLQVREKQKEEQVETLKRSMQGGMAQAMKEQAQLREEMAYQYKLGNFEAAAAIQRRLDPDIPILLSAEKMDIYATNPGPIDDSVLYDQDKHVSAAVWEGQERGALRCHEHTSKLDQWTLTSKQVELVKKAGFGYLRLIPAISLDNPLISALVERWRRETNTFHLTVGEMTVTLEDVAYLLGLAVDGEPVIGVTYTTCEAGCVKFLGKAPDSGYTSGGMVKLSWLKETFSRCPEDAAIEDIERHTRAYLLYLVAGKYAWGAAALSFLYRALGNASLKAQSTISGCLTLLQCWSYYRLNVGRPKLNHDPIHDSFPFVLKWKERHLPDRCLKQYGIQQTIPEDVPRWERKSRGVDGGIDLSGKMESELSEWSNRRLHIVDSAEDVDESEYTHWYLRITRKLVGRPIPISSEFQRMNTALRDIAHLADTLSTNGMDDQQIYSVTRIRYIAHECLRDQVGSLTITVNSENELGKSIRGKERVRRKGMGKRKRRDDPEEYNVAGEDAQSQLCDTTVELDAVEVDHQGYALYMMKSSIHIYAFHPLKPIMLMTHIFRHTAKQADHNQSSLAPNECGSQLSHAAIELVPQLSLETSNEVAHKNDYGVLV